MSYQDPGARTHTCPDCGHYGWAHGRHGCVVVRYDKERGHELTCSCVRARESFIAKAFDACWRE